MARFRLGLGGLSLGLFAMALSPVGCGTEHPPVSGGTGYGSTTGSSAGGGGDQFNTDAGTIKPPGCGSKPDGSQCDCVDAPLFIDPPVIYFVLDRSGSMGTPDKWTQVRVTVAKIMRSLGPRANFGATMFPAPSATEACLPGKEVMPVSPGDPPSSTVDGPTTTKLLNVTRLPVGGGTPTASTLTAVLPSLKGIAGRRFVILATDGAPNCNPQVQCPVDQCQLNIQEASGCPAAGPNCCLPPTGYRENCNDVQATIDAVTALKNAGIPVYVVGLPGADGPYASFLDQMAIAGGTAQSGSPKYFAVNAASEPVMLAALKKIAAQITGTCVFDLKQPPADPALVNVYMDDEVLPFEPQNGWTISGKTVTLVGDACNRVKNGDVLDVRIIAGCPRIEPK